MRKSKTLALLVALCMLVAILPAVPVATAEAADTDIVLDFYLDANNAAGLGNVKIGTNGSNWEVDKTGTSYGYLGTGSGQGDIPSGWYNALRFSFASHKITFKFEVPTAGFYSLDLSALVHPSLVGEVGVSVTNGSGKKYTLNSIEFGTVADVTDWYAYAKTKLTGDDNLVYLDKGYNYLTFAGASGNPYVMLRSCTFEKVTYLNFTTSDIGGGEKNVADYDINTLGWALNTATSSPSAFDASRLFWYSLSADKSVMIDFVVVKAGYYVPALTLAYNHVENDGNSLEVRIGDMPLGKAPAGSEAQPAATFALDKAVYLAAGQHTLAVKNISSKTQRVSLKNMSFKAVTANSTMSAAAVTLPANGKATTPVTFTTTDGKAIAENIAVSVADPTKASATYANGVLTVAGVAEGSTTVTLTAASGAATTVDVTVTGAEPVEVSLDFSNKCGIPIDSNDRYYIQNGTFENCDWQINSELTTATDYNGYMNENRSIIRCGVNTSVAVDFKAVEGTYDLSLYVQRAANDYGGVYKVQVGNAADGYSDAGVVYNDSNGVDENSIVWIKLKNVVLKDGVNTIIFTRLPAADRDKVNSDGDDKNILDEGYLYLGKVKLTPVKSGEKHLSSFALTAPAELEVGTNGSVSSLLIYTDTSSENVTVADFGDGIVKIENGTITALKAGVTTIYARKIADGVEYETRKNITVTAAPSADIEDAEEGSPFASKYAYIEENNDGTFNVTFIGGINELAGYSAVGFEIVAGEDEAVYSESANVYEQLSVNGGTYTADIYGGKYIFVGSRDEIAAGSTVVARPYVVVDGEKQLLANATLRLQF